MEINKDKVVVLQYALRENDASGNLIQETTDAQPFAFLFGHGNVIPGFETNLKGKKQGDSFAFAIPSKDAYGEKDETAILDLPIDNFKVNGEIQRDLLVPGRSITMSDQDGNKMQATILGVTDTQVKLDFNHPMAGKDLHFSGTITEVRLASAEELSHGHVHGPGGHHH